MPSRNLQQIKVGDRVWVADRYGSKLRTVTKLTPTQIIVENWNGSGVDRFQRGKPSRYAHLGHEPTYYQIGYHGFALPELTRIATKDECRKWDAEQAIAKHEAEAAREAREQLEAKRKELNSLFSGHAYVQDTHNNKAGDWQVSVYTDETGVRRLAEFLNASDPDT